MACSKRVIVDERSRRAAGSAARRIDVGSMLQASRAMLQTWLLRGRQRQALSDLDDHLLRDIGLTSAEVARERAKRFWRP
jgi:uncharacterized protein YjiS (DUF1127 family)